MKKQPFLTIELLRRLFSPEYIIVKNKPALTRKKILYNTREVAYLICADWKAFDLIFFLRKEKIIRNNGLPYKHFTKYGIIGGRKLGTNDYETIFTEEGVAYLRETYLNGPMEGLLN